MGKTKILNTFQELISNQEFVQKRITEQHEYMQMLERKYFMRIISRERYNVLHYSASHIAGYFQYKLMEILKK